MTQEQIERELSKLYLEINQKPLKYGLGIYQQINKLEQHHKGLHMSNILQFHSAEYIHCNNLVKQYEDLAELLLVSTSHRFKMTNKRMERLYFVIEDLVEGLNNKQQLSIMQRLSNIIFNTRAELESRGFYATK